MTGSGVRVVVVVKSAVTNGSVIGVPAPELPATRHSNRYCSLDALNESGTAAPTTTRPPNGHARPSPVWSAGLPV